MPRLDKYHQNVRIALEKDGWTITDDPLQLQYGKRGVSIDLGAEKLIGASKNNSEIAVEIKGFEDPSPVYTFHTAIGQYSNYRRALKKNNEQRILFLAIPGDVYNTFFQEDFVLDALKEENIHLLVFNPINNQIIVWIN